MRKKFYLETAVAITLFLAGASRAKADPTLATLYSFNDPYGMCWFPSGHLAIDAAGNLYGTTAHGAFTADNSPYGVAYELSGSNHQTMTILAQLGGIQYSGLTLDSAGNLYGTGWTGPTFELSGADHRTVTDLASFDGTYSGSGDSQDSQLSVDNAGDVYGTAEGISGAAANSVFELSGSSHGLSTLFTIQAGAGSDFPVTTMIDSNGNLFGTTAHGTVFELTGTSHQTSTTLARFDSGFATSRLAEDTAGDLFGINGGTAFELSGPKYQILTLLATIPGYDPFEAPGLIVDAAGDLFGVAGENGSVFELSRGDYQTVKTVVSFNGLGWGPGDALTADAEGNLYGVSHYGGAYQDGAVYEITGSSFAVPEPGGLWLLAIGGAGLLRRRNSLRRFQKISARVP
jgi:hypothetical protein